jgi:hypothetical protein
MGYQMNATEITALNNIVQAKALKAARADLAVGTHQVDVTVRVTGTVTVGEDYTRTPTVGVPVKEVLALFLARSGALREANVKLLQACFAEAMADGAGKGKDALKEAVADLDTVWADQVDALLAGMPVATVKGPVTTKLAVAEVVQVAADAAMAAK